MDNVIDKFTLKDVNLLRDGEQSLFCYFIGDMGSEHLGMPKQNIMFCFDPVRSAVKVLYLSNTEVDRRLKVTGRHSLHKSVNTLFSSIFADRHRANFSDIARMRNFFESGGKTIFPRKSK